MREIGAEEGGIGVMAPKSQHLCVMLDSLEPQDANILKQEALSAGADCAVAAGAVRGEGRTDAFLMGTFSQLKTIKNKLAPHYPRLKRLGEEIAAVIENSQRSRFEMTLPGKRALVLGERTLVMGILNVTPDSFSDGGAHYSTDAAVDYARCMIAAGADIIDIGGESTRPGSEGVTLDEELRRTIPVIERLAQESGILISIDTRKAEVARRALKAGASIINDVSALYADPAMAKVVAESEAPVILMHMKGTPKDMQKEPSYKDAMAEIIGFFRERISYAESCGIPRERIILDPGLGFGKRTGGGVEDNCGILRRWRELLTLGLPTLVGASRKTFIGNVCGGIAGVAKATDASGGTGRQCRSAQLPPSERLEGGLAAAAVAVMNGACIIRAHDVLETRRCADLLDAVIGGQI
ncbi:MAG: dihydropteroate synthase [Thermoplasmata archaeon HGW-Thermoplasmata-1]|nr:MAG: dihydropteroate synthase [Thermoplasmata archaeon HGW-Thermoplasmata-1]